MEENNKGYGNSDNEEEEIITDSHEDAARTRSKRSGKKHRTARIVAGITLLLCCCILISSVCGGVSAYLVYSFLPLFDSSDKSPGNAVSDITSSVPDGSLEPMADVSTTDDETDATEEPVSETQAPLPPETTQAPEPQTEPMTQSETQPSALSASRIYSENVNSLVGISAYSTQKVSLLLGVYTTREKVSNGSGFFISSDGYILTNNHVVAGAHTYIVSLYNGTTYEAVLAGSDPSNDMAVLKISGGEFVPVTLGESSEVAVGDNVLIIGNALGELSFTLTSGVVSYLNRSVSVDSNVMDMHQTDAAINVGNSGGPVFDMHGNVIGIASAKMSSESIEGLGFFIPIDDVKSKIIEIIA